MQVRRMSVWEWFDHAFMPSYLIAQKKGGMRSRAGFVKTYQLKLKIYIKENRKNISVACIDMTVFSIILN